jgi:hypothetical protein
VLRTNTVKPAWRGQPYFARAAARESARAPPAAFRRRTPARTGTRAGWPFHSCMALLSPRLYKMRPQDNTAAASCVQFEENRYIMTILLEAFRGTLSGIHFSPASGNPGNLGLVFEVVPTHFRNPGSVIPIRSGRPVCTQKMEHSGSPAAPESRHRRHLVFLSDRILGSPATVTPADAVLCCPARRIAWRPPSACATCNRENGARLRGHPRAGSDSRRSHGALPGREGSTKRALTAFRDGRAVHPGNRRLFFQRGGLPGELFIKIFNNWDIDSRISGCVEYPEGAGVS